MRTTWIYILFFFCIILLLIPLFPVKYLPIVDLPNHLLNAYVHSLPGHQTSDGYLKSSWIASPYILFLIIFDPLVRIFGPLAAARVMSGICLVMLPLGIFVWMRRFNPKFWYLAFLAIPFSYSYHFEFGFFAYCLGVPLALMAIAATDKALQGSWRWTLIAALLSVLVYASHFINLMAFGFALVLLWFLRRRSPSASWRILVISAPAILLGICYIINIMIPNGYGSEMVMRYSSIKRQLFSLVRFAFSINPVLDALRVVAMSALFGSIAFLCGIRLKKGFALYFALAMVLMTILLPGYTFLGGWGLSNRFAIFAFIAFLGTIQFKRYPNILPGIIGAACLAVLAIGIVFRTGYYRKIDDYTKSVLSTSSENMTDGSLIYTVYVGNPNITIPPLLHYMGYYHVEHKGWSPFLFSDKPYVCGFESGLKMPASGELYCHLQSDSLDLILEHYDYMNVVTYANVLPPEFNKYSDKLIYMDSCFAIYDFRERVGEIKADSD
jgi:hypothetical protein